MTTYKILLVTLIAGLLQACTPPAFESVDPATLNATNAYDEVAALADYLPRDAGTAEGHKAAEYLKSRFEVYGLQTRLDEFDAKIENGTLPMVNVVATIPGKKEGLIVLGSHFDTKVGIAPFEGANDSGSSTGLLLELARCINQSGWNGPELQLVLYDGEECRHNYSDTDGLHGSSFHAKQILPRKDEVLGVIILDMIGDRDLSVTLPRNSDPTLRAMALRAAETAGCRKLFGIKRGQGYILDDHEPYRLLGMPALDIIDFEFGSQPGANDYWHTPEDSLDKISAESLGHIGRVTLIMLNELSAK